MKAEPESRLEKGVDVKFSIDDLRTASEPVPWDGVYLFNKNVAAAGWLIVAGVRNAEGEYWRFSSSFHILFHRQLADLAGGDGVTGAGRCPCRAHTPLRLQHATICAR